MVDGWHWLALLLASADGRAVADGAAN